MTARSKEHPPTRWDVFAAAALSGVASLPESGCNSPSDLAHYAASVADAMMTERAKRFPGQQELPI